MNVLETFEPHKDIYPEYAKKCPKCGSLKIVRKVEGYIDYKECEVSYRCGICGEYVAYWAYGYYDPIYDPTYRMSVDEKEKHLEQKEKQLEQKYKSNMLQEDYEEALSRINL